MMFKLFMTLAGYTFALWANLGIALIWLNDRKFFRAAWAFTSTIVIFMAMFKVVTG